MLVEVMSQLVCKWDLEEKPSTLEIAEVAAKSGFRIVNAGGDDVDLVASTFQRAFCVQVSDADLGDRIKLMLAGMAEVTISNLRKGIMQLELPPGDGEEPASHCFITTALSCPWSWKIGDVQLSRREATRCFLRIAEVEKVSLRGSAYPLHGVGGHLVAVDGDLYVHILPANRLGDEALDLNGYMLLIQDEAVLKNDDACILTAGCAVWVPFGHVAITIGLNAQRSTLSSISGARGRPKQGLLAKKPPDERSYVMSMMIPCLAETDVNDLQVARLVSNRLTSNQKKLSQTWIDGSGYSDWLLTVLTAVDQINKKDAEIAA